MPFFFVYNPILLLGQYPFSFELILAVVTSILGMICVSSGLFKYFWGHLNFLESVIIFAAGLCMVSPNIIFSLVGAAIMVAVIFWQKARQKIATAEV